MERKIETKQDIIEGMDSLASSIDNVAKASVASADAVYNLEQTMDVLLEMLDIDRDVLKRKLIIAALNNLSQGKESGYSGDLYTDTLNLVENLITEKEYYKDLFESLDKDKDRLNAKYRELRDDVSKYLKARDHAVDILELRYDVPFYFEPKNKYTYVDVINILEKFRSVFVEEITNKAATILMDEGSPERPLKVAPIRFA